MHANFQKKSANKSQDKHTLHNFEKTNCFEVSISAAMAETANLDWTRVPSRHNLSRKG